MNIIRYPYKIVCIIDDNVLIYSEKLGVHKGAVLNLETQAAYSLKDVSAFRTWPCSDDFFREVVRTIAEYNTIVQ